MELALAMGRTEESLAGEMTEREFARWRRYMNRYRLPFRRLELGLAMVALKITQSMGGGADVSLSDFLIPDDLLADAAPAKDDAPKRTATVHEAREAFGFRPRNVNKATT